MKWTRILFLSLLASGAAQADDYINYVGIGYATLDQGDRFTINGNNVSVETGDGMLRFGGDINKWTGMELRAGGTAQPEEQTFTGNAKLEVENDYFAGAYFRVKYPLSWVNLYAQAGFVRVKETVKFNNSSASDKFNDSSWAAGLDIYIGQRWILNGEFFHLSSENSVDREGPGASIMYRF